MYIEREIKEKFMKISKSYPIVAIVGPRQSGKTTFLIENSKEKNSVYLLFDDPDIRDLFDEDIKRFENQNLEGYDVSILDEIQYGKDPGRKLKYLADTGRKLWITSSSEILLNKEVLSYLVGRVSVIKLFPFSIKEFLDFKKQKEINEKILKRNIYEHLNYGGYPKVVISNDKELKEIILRDLYETMIIKDISRTFSIDDIKSLEKIVKYLAINIGGLINYEDISRDINISFQTLKKYLDALELSYLIIRILPYFTNKSKELVKQPKIYFIDCGLRNIITKELNKDPDGKLFENYIATELIKIGFIPKYWRTKSKAEVDFIIEKKGEIIPIEVKLKSGKISRSLKSFIETYKPKISYIVTYDGKEKTIKHKECKVIFTNVWKLRENLN